MIAKTLLDFAVKPSYLPVVHVFEGNLTKEVVNKIKEKAVSTFKDEEDGDEGNIIYTFCDGSAILIMKDTTHMIYEDIPIGCK